ncbi:MAG: sulfatase-like hydrolase/transferase [Acidobacteria bacterium]|nr:sulfatase-like hydrolase/transferase [Acidobacteriota bacterium]
MIRRLLIAAWLGFALAALFLYPLAVALVSDSYYLQWQTQDVIESVTALTGLTLAFAAAVFVLWPRSSRSATLALLAVALLPLASFAAGVARQLPFEDALRSAWEGRALRFTVLSLAALVVVIAFVRWPQAFARWFRRFLVVVSPASLVVVASIGLSALRPAVPISVERNPSTASTGGATCAPVLALLFDELSFSYLYDESGMMRDEFLEIRRLASEATNYLTVAAPARDTLVALPSLLAARHLRDVRVEDDGLWELDDEGELVPFSAGGDGGLFATARRLGYATEMGGYYLPYCDLLEGLIDTCQSLSFYNVSTTHEEFAPFDPMLTTLVLWPRQLPFGLVKSPSFALLQRELVADVLAFARRPMIGRRPVFRFAHFSIPHLPFAFDAEGYDPPFDSLQTSPDTEYVEQLGYVDRVVGEIVDELRREGTYDETTIVLLSDHGFRFGGRERDPLQIPFIVKMAGQRARVDVRAAARGELLLKDVVQRSCALPTRRGV